MSDLLDWVWAGIALGLAAGISYAIGKTVNYEDEAKIISKAIAPCISSGIMRDHCLSELDRHLSETPVHFRLKDTP